jgi:hypothetical protein
VLSRKKNSRRLYDACFSRYDNACAGFWWRNLKERGDWGIIGVDVRIILKLVLKKESGRVSTE